MRRLAKPEVLRSTFVAALGTTLLCYPRLSLWSTRQLPIWYLEATLFFGGFVLWAFVFAWHTEYTRRPVLALRIDRRILAGATAIGLAVAAFLHFVLDPAQRLRVPEDYPNNLVDWIAKTLFGLAFLQLFLTFAPFAWLMRLFRDQRIAAPLTVAFSLLILFLKRNASPDPAPAAMFALLLATRVFLALLSLWCYLRGGLLLAWWWGLLIEMRHLPWILRGE